MAEQAGYSPAVAPGAAPAAPTSGLAIVSLIAGILGWTAAPFFGSLAAVITGHLARKEIRLSGGRLQGDLPATIGLVLGWVSLVMSALAVCLVLSLIALGIISLPFVVW